MSDTPLIKGGLRGDRHPPYQGGIKGGSNLKSIFNLIITSYLCLNQYQFNILAITPEHTDALITLPFYHKGPFDRLLVAQAIVENIPIISVDTILDRYGIQRLW